MNFGSVDIGAPLTVSSFGSIRLKFDEFYKELGLDMDKEIKITQVRSTIGRLPAHRRTVRALGLRRIGHTVVQKDSPAIRGMVNTVSYLVKVEE